MKQSLVLLGLLAGGLARADVGVISPWVIPETHRYILAPHQATQPILSGDILYSATRQGNLRAIHATEGYVLWKKQLPAGAEGGLGYGRAKLLVGDVQGNLLALNARDGSEVWSVSRKGEWLSPPVIKESRAYALLSTGQLFAFVAQDGQEAWQYSRSGDEKMTIRGLGSPTVYGKELFQGFADGYVVALSTETGKELWAKKLRTKERFYDVDMAPAVDEKSVFVAAFDGNFYSLNRVDGRIQWVFPVGSHANILVEEDRLFFSGLDGNVYALSRNGGKEIWKTAFGPGVANAPVRVGDILVVTTSSGPVYGLDRASGKILWNLSLGTGSFAAATGHPDNWFYSLSNYGNLFAFKLIPHNNFRKEPKTFISPSAFKNTLG